MCSSRRGDDSEPGGANSGEKAKCDEPKEKTFHDAAVEFNAVIGKYPIPSFVTCASLPTDCYDRQSRDPRIPETLRTKRPKNDSVPPPPTDTLG